MSSSGRRWAERNLFLNKKKKTNFVIFTLPNFGQTVTNISYSHNHSLIIYGI